MNRPATLLLGLSTIAIFAITILAVIGHGWLWPAVFFPDLLALNWRSQFNTDLLLHLLLLGSWVAWREGFGLRGAVLGLFCVIWGGMFTFPYLLWVLADSAGDAGVMVYGRRRVAAA